ncbi:MAG: hypothetical protein K8R74_10000, partial [Bacteroidales bacterium]|nr:hypothetical protein [Bacteroidales bacterium]
MTGFAVLPTVGADPNLLYNPLEPNSRGNIPSGTIKSVSDICASLIDGADYLKHSQADITEDNAGNGNPDVPDDPDDGGWDWILTSPAFTHSTAASPPNIYGATAQGLYYAYLKTGDATYKTALDDAAGVMSINAGIRSAADLIFLMLYDDLPSVAGTIYQDAARAKYDARITTYGSATLFAQYIRDVRALSHGYPNGIIAWDIGAWARVAAMLHDRYPGNGYDSDADDIAEVIYQDSFMLNPGYFDIYSDNGWDPTYATVDYYWYTLGITGLIDAFNFANVHTSDIPILISILMNCQYPSGAFSFSYGANTLDEDWQSTAYAVMSLAMLDQDTYQTNINDAGDWIASTQDVSGGWVYGSGNHYPEIGGENTAALYFGGPVKNIDTGETFCTIQSAIDDSDTLNGHTIEVDDGTYYEHVIIDKEITLDRASKPIIDGGGSGTVVTIKASNVVINGFDITNGDYGVKTYGGPSAYANVIIKNSEIYHNNLNGMLITYDTLTDWIINNVKIYDTYGYGGNGIGIAHSATINNMLLNKVFIYNNVGHGIYINGATVNGLTMQDRVKSFNNGWEGIHVINSQVTELLITDNCTIKDNAGFGIIFKGTSILNHVTIEESEISGNTGGSGLAFVCSGTDIDVIDCDFFGNAWEDIDLGTGWMGASSFNDVLIYGCDFTSGPAWGQVVIDASASPLSGIEIHQNNFRAGTGIGNGNAVTVDGTCNWWATVAGPNAGGAGFYGPVTYCPWLDAPYPTGDCIGGATVHNIIQDTWYCCIQCAIDDADPYDTIEVSPGIYEEILYVDQPITILGATHGICKNGYTVPTDYAWDDTTESIIQPPVGHEDDLLIHIYDVDDVTFDGFIVQALERGSSGNRMLMHVEAQTQTMENINIINNI